MSIEKEALAHIASFYIGKLNKLQYKDAPTETDDDRPLYDPPKAELQLRSSAHDMYYAVLELKKGNFRSSLSPGAKEQLAEHFENFTISGTLSKKFNKIDVFTLTKKIELQLEQRAERDRLEEEEEAKKEAEKKAKKAA